LRVPWRSPTSPGEPGQDDVRLIGEAQQGDRTAFGELYRRHARMIHGVLLARVPYGDVDDLVQDVFLQAMERLDTLREAGAFRGWLATIARNRATDHLRRVPQTTELPDDLPAHESTADRTEAAAALAIIRTLPEAYRETLILRLVEGFTGPEIAAQTGLTEGSVRVNLHRGMKQLRERLEQQAPGARDDREQRDDRDQRDVKDERS
jgi:RNA polymerase sigma-70 factor, ECF subfamily